MNGPSAFGLWAGKGAADICAELTKVPASTWDIMASECILLIDRQFNSMYVTISFVIWAECMAPGGQIWIAVPDFEAVVAQYAVSKNLKELTGLLYGGQRDMFDYHKIAFDFASIQAALETAGFANVQRYNHADFLPAGFDDWSRSYLPHMDVNGRLMSLNVTATKR